MKIVFDGNDGDARAFTFAPYGNDGGGRQDIDIEPAVRASTVEVRALDIPGVSSERPVTGIDNLWIKVQRDEAWHARSVGLLNVGGLVKHPNQEWKPRRETDEPPAAWVYEIRYEDGSGESFPVLYGRHAAAYRSAGEPSGLAGASLAWTIEAPSGEGAHLSVYSAQWTNPKPGTAIESVTLRYGEQGDRWGRPMLLGITAATAAE